MEMEKVSLNLGLFITKDGFSNLRIFFTKVFLHGRIFSVDVKIDQKVPPGSPLKKENNEISF